MEITDFTGVVWTTVFDEKASAWLGVTGDQLAQLQKEDVIFLVFCVFNNIFRLHNTKQFLIKFVFMSLTFVCV